MEMSNEHTQFFVVWAADRRPQLKAGDGARHRDLREARLPSAPRLATRASACAEREREREQQQLALSISLCDSRAQFNTSAPRLIQARV
mmetsp:Transcript_28987/g.60857  ORF Transcript_28987/g.60857 Transcript_28987/m.60857 type:complete len:89 (+) Transcript_28987:180-446(+)|eukprot:1210714-Pleurochrysis_carterae.AAC.1